MCNYSSIKYQVNREIENVSKTSKLSPQEIKRKLISDWNKEVYNVRRISNMEIEVKNDG